MIIIMKKKVFVSGCYDLLHSGHVEFFQQASQYGDLYVGIGSDATYLEYKHRKPMFPQEERLFMVKNIKAVKDAYINEGSGVIDFLPTLDKVKPDVFVVNAEGGSDEKRRICKERGIEYVELQRTPHAGLKARSSSGLKKALLNVSDNSAQEVGIPTRLDLAGTWIDQPYVSMYHPGWAITISLEPTFEVRDRCGLSTSTRKMIQKIWPVKLPKMDPEMLARLVFCFENNPERHDGIISGAQDSIGICVPGLVRHYYDNNFWPEKIESTQDEMTLRFLEDHLVMIPMEPRRPRCSVVEGKEQPLLHVGLCPWHPGGAESAFPGVVPYQQGDVGLDAGCCLWCLLSDGTACRMDYPEVGLQEGSDNRTGALRYRCPDVHTGKQDQQFLLLRSVAVCDRMRTDLSGNECESLYYGTGTS